MSRCGGICATTNISMPAISMLRPWSMKRLPWSNPEEYMVSSPAQASRNTAKASGPSKPCSMGAARCKKEGLSNTADMERNYLRCHHCFHACYASALSPWLSLLPAIDQSPPGRGPDRPAPPTGHVVVPPTAAFAQGSHGHAGTGHRGVAEAVHGGDGFVAGRL